MTYKLFKCSIASAKFFFKDGNVAYFVNGRYATDNENYIAELEAEIKAKHPHIFVDENEKETAQITQDPMSALKEKLRAELLAEMEAKKTPDMGTSDKSAGAGAGITTSAVTEKLAALSKSK